MKKLVIISLGLLLAGCANAPRQYEDAYVPEARDFRIEEMTEPEVTEVPQPTSEEEFVSANGEICSVVGAGAGTKAICKSGNTTTEVEGIISGSI